MPPSKAFDLTTQFKVAADGGVVEYAEAIDDGHRAAGHLDHFIGVEGLNIVLSA